MSITASQLQELVSAGLNPEQLIMVAKIIEEKENIIALAKQKARDRKRKQRDESRDSHGTVTGQTRDMDTISPLDGSDGFPHPSLNSLIPPIKTPKGVKNVPKFVLPDWMPLQDWEDFCKHRGAKFKIRAKELIIQKLEALKQSGNDPGGVLRQSIERGWKGVFEIKQENYGTPRKQDTLDIVRNAIARTT